MEVNRIPDKIVVYYDILSNTLLVRVVDKDFKDIVKFDRLPAMCRISDLYVDIIKVDDFKISNNLMILNNVYSFVIEDNKTITNISKIDGLTFNCVDEDTNIVKDIFSIQLT